MPCSLFLQVIHNDIFFYRIGTYYLKSVTSIIEVSVVRSSAHTLFYNFYFFRSQFGWSLLKSFCSFGYRRCDTGKSRFEMPVISVDFSIGDVFIFVFF
jgi:hypothetical protein